MTCDEYRLIVVRHPNECTTSENLSSEIHYHDCKSCLTWLNGLAEQKKAQMNPFDVFMCEMWGLVTGERVKAAAMADPELRPMAMAMSERQKK